MTSTIAYLSGASNKYNNAGIASIAISSVLNHTSTLSLAKALLIMPIVMHNDTTRYLANERTRSRTVATLVTIRPDFVSNFDRRYHSSLVHSINALQLLHTLGQIELDFGAHLQIKQSSKFELKKEHGKRAALIDKASSEIANLLSSSDEELYLNLRIEL